MEKKRLSLISGIVALFLPIVAFAQEAVHVGRLGLPPIVDPINVCRACVAGDNYVKCLVNNIVNCIVWPVFVVTVVTIFLLAGIQFLLAKGDAGKIDTAKKTAIWGVVGLVFAIISFSIIATVRWLLGV